MAWQNLDILTLNRDGDYVPLPLPESGGKVWIRIPAFAAEQAGSYQIGIFSQPDQGEQGFLDMLTRSIAPFARFISFDVAEGFPSPHLGMRIINHADAAPTYSIQPQLLIPTPSTVPHVQALWTWVEQISQNLDTLRLEAAGYDDIQALQESLETMIQGIESGNGSVGPAGPPGPAGASAYSLWINAGNLGTISEFLASLAGSPGADGAPGVAGPAGPAGADGAPGVAGPAGPAGADGAPGAPGVAGPAGPAGADGAQGPAGPPGADGAAGADGVDGVDGAQGPQGPPGADGAQGPAGPAGPPGADGAAGADGVDGVDGAQGPAGPAGSPGADGAQGPQGLPGAQGPQGPAGADGATGPTGADGAQGPQGLPGAQGPQGLPGAQGPAAAATEFDFYGATDPGDVSLGKTWREIGPAGLLIDDWERVGSRWMSRSVTLSAPVENFNRTASVTSNFYCSVSPSLFAARAAIYGLGMDGWTFSLAKMRLSDRQAETISTLTILGSGELVLRGDWAIMSDSFRTRVILTPPATPAGIYGYHWLEFRRVRPLSIPIN